MRFLQLWAVPDTGELLRPWSPMSWAAPCVAGFVVYAIIYCAISIVHEYCTCPCDLHAHRFAGMQVTYVFPMACSAVSFVTSFCNCTCLESCSLLVNTAAFSGVQLLAYALVFCLGGSALSLFGVVCLFLFWCVLIPVQLCADT
jgi:hypothetical protein